jgi:hypothetical protein
MGRGRAKAKQTKVARRLKYSTPSMDLDALRQELSGSSGEHHEPEESDDFEYDYDDPYADIYGDDEDDEGEDDDGDGDDDVRGVSP